LSDERAGEGGRRACRGGGNDRHGAGPMSEAT
jgi:hypothetical protein